MHAQDKNSWKHNQWRIQGSGPGARPPPHLFSDQTEARRAEKNFTTAPSPLSQDLDDPPPAPLSGGMDPPLIISNNWNFLLFGSEEGTSYNGK